MKIIVNNIDISELIGNLTWSGDKNQVARKLTFSYLYTREDSNVPVVNIEEGNTIVMYDDTGIELFLGIVIKRSRSEASITISVDAVDLAWYTSKNKVFSVYKGTAAEITKAVCSEFGIITGSLLETTTQTEIISTGDKTIYGVIAEAYKVSGRPYSIEMAGSSLQVLEEGNCIAAVLSASSNITDATYTSTIENMVNKVIILDKDSKRVGEVENTSDIVAYGLLQETYSESEDTDTMEAAKQVLKQIENSGNITALGNVACITGRAVYVTEVNSRITGKFTIISDSHSFSNGEHIMTLGLNFCEVV